MILKNLNMSQITKKIIYLFNNNIITYY